MRYFKAFDDYIKNAVDSWHCPGAAIAIVKGNDLLYQHAYGLRDVEEQLPMTEETRFPIASITKSFTAMSVALLVDKGRLEWDKPVQRYMPAFILQDPYATEHVTVRDMLSHRTGLPRHDLSAWRLDLSRSDFIKRMKHLKFSSSFREKFQYNNLMYYAAAHLVETVAEQRWEAFVQERIFSPLGMVASNFTPEPPVEGQVNAKGYRVDRDKDGAAKGLIHIPFGLHTALSPGAAGGVFSTLQDLTQWLKTHLNNGQLGDLQLVSQDNLKQMHLPQSIIPGGGLHEALLGSTISTYGMGWFVEPYQGHTLIHHGGNVEGHSLIIGFIPQKKIGVIVLTNVASLPLQTALLYEGLDRALGLPAQDWNARFHAMTDPIITGEAKRKQTTAKERLETAPHTHPLNSYIGTYEAPGYPDFAVKREDGALQACTVGSLDWSTLQHIHFNVFDWYFRAGFNACMRISFFINDHGQIDSVSIPIEPDVENLTFTRKPPELSEELIAALIGEYDLPMDGMKFTITSHAGKVYATQTGMPSAELWAYQLSGDLVGFRMGRSRLDFARSNGAISHLLFKTPSMVLEAPRRR